MTFKLYLGSFEGETFDEQNDPTGGKRMFLQKLDQLHSIVEDNNGLTLRACPDGRVEMNVFFNIDVPEPDRSIFVSNLLSEIRQDAAEGLHRIIDEFESEVVSELPKPKDGETTIHIRTIEPMSLAAMARTMLLTQALRKLLKEALTS